MSQSNPCLAYAMPLEMFFIQMADQHLLGNGIVCYSVFHFIFITRLIYNCAHLRSTKESLKFEYFETGRYWLVLGGTWSV